LSYFLEQDLNYVHRDGDGNLVDGGEMNCGGIANLISMAFFMIGERDGVRECSCNGRYREATPQQQQQPQCGKGSAG
jgi:hypothetical protein